MHTWVNPFTVKYIAILSSRTWQTLLTIHQYFRHLKCNILKMPYLRQIKKSIYIFLENLKTINSSSPQYVAKPSTCPLKIRHLVSFLIFHRLLKMHHFRNEEWFPSGSELDLTRPTLIPFCDDIAKFMDYPFWYIIYNLKHESSNCEGRTVPSRREISLLQFLHAPFW